MKQRPVRRAYILIITITSIIAVIFGFKYILPLFLPFVFGYFLARLAAPMVHFLKVRLRIPRAVASILVVTTFLFVCVVSFYFILRAASHQIQIFVTSLPIYQNLLFHSLDGVCKNFDGVFGLSEGTSYVIVTERMDGMIELLQVKLLSGVSNRALDVVIVIFGVLWNCIMIFISALLLVKEFEEYKEEFKNSCFYKEIHMVTGVLSNLGVAYLKAQFILMCITAVICMIGVFLTGNHYAILIGAGIAVFDAFPVLGSAFILIPWAVILLIKKEVIGAAIILSTYLICQLVRQMLEPKLVGDRIGIRPVYTLISMYVGLKIYGGLGFILGPISLVAIRAIINAGVARLRGTTE